MANVSPNWSHLTRANPSLFLAMALLLAPLAPARIGAASPAPANPPRLPGTGQTSHFTQTFGEDSDFKGRLVGYADNGDGTVTDRVTGLIWQKTDGGEMTWERAMEYARTLNLAGQRDWRLPTSMELFSLMDHGKHGPAMDTAFFTRTEARYWWTDRARADDASKIWVVNSGGGIGAHAKSETVSAGGERPMHVRCVRGRPVFGPGPRLQENGDGSVTDLATGLIWQKVGRSEAMTWEEGLKYCFNLRLAGKQDWRMPDIKELRSLSDDARVQPSFDTSLFPNARADNYWSSTSQENQPQRAWFVDFHTGLVTYADKLDRQFVLAVRGGGVTAPASIVKAAPDLKLFANPAGGKGKGKNGEGRKKGGEARQPSAQ